MKLLTTSNAKIRKGEKSGYQTRGLHLAPSNLSGFNTCSFASDGCAAACLNTSGRGAQGNVQDARINKTIFFFKERASFMEKAIKEIKSAIKKAEKNGLIPCFRLNLTSDLPWEKIKFEGKTIFELFPTVQFYDYTKVPSRMIQFLAGNLPSNYHLTFSKSESNDSEVQFVTKNGGNVAVVFAGKELPNTYLGKQVIDGDKDDLRFLDPAGVVVGLLAKGKAKKDKSGFVVSAKGKGCK